MNDTDDGPNKGEKAKGSSTLLEKFAVRRIDSDPVLPSTPFPGEYAHAVSLDGQEPDGRSNRDRFTTPGRG